MVFQITGRLSSLASNIYSSIWRSRVSSCKRRYTSALLVVALVTFIYYRLNLVNYAWYNRPRRSPGACRVSKHHINELAQLSHDIHSVLKRLNVTHWLAYGSLWGAIRYGAPVPWDNDVDIGVVYRDIQRIRRGRLADELGAVNINMYYSYWGGFYRVIRGNVRADLMVFQQSADNTMMQRVGIESYVFFVNYHKMHTFPAKLVYNPLPSAPFGGVALPVPHHGVEIQKYHYPYDWWKENKPIGC